jgi:hypothetical protein
LSFSEVTSRLGEHSKIMDVLRRSQLDLLTMGKIENTMVKDMLIVTYTAYQKYVIEAVLQKVDRHSDHPSLVNFVREKIKKTNIDIDTLANILGMLDPRYASNFELTRQDEDITTAYTNIVVGRHNVAHGQGDNLQFGSLTDVEAAHNQAKHLLESFRNCMF